MNIYTQNIPACIRQNYKVLLIMKLILLIMTITMVHVNASTFAQKISLSERNVSLKKVFREIRSQSGYNFIYTDGTLKAAKPVTINVNQEPLEQVLNKVFYGQSLTFTINRNTIVVKEREKYFFEKDVRFSDIRGRVIDDKGVPLPGATVKVKGTSTATTSDANGVFLLKNVDPSSTLVISFTGFTAQEIAVGSTTSFEIVLKEDTQALGEVVVVGYGSVQRKDLTGAVSRVTADDIKNIPITRVDQMLQGRATGVDVKSTNGAPGAGTTIRIRGSRSINASNEPLYVVDGLIDATNLNTLNPQDIASIEILKDASATAIYGARAANGVILVTTKRGQAGKDNVNFNVIAGAQKIPEYLDLMNARQFAEFINEARKESRNVTPYPDVDAVVAKVGEAGTNWTDAITRTAGYQTYNLSTSGGTGGAKGLTYFLSGNVVNQDGIVMNTNYKKYQGRINLNKSFSDKLKMGLVLNASRYRIEKGNVNFGANLNWSSNMITLAPTIPLYRADGTYESYNPFNNNGAETDVVTYVAMLTRNNNTVNDLQSNAFLEYELVKGLKLKSSFGTSLSTNKENFLNPSQMPAKIAAKNETANASSGTGSSIYLLNENILTYDRRINEHHFNVVGGFTYENRDANNMKISVTNLGDDVMLWDNFGAAAQANRGVESGASKNTKLSYLGRVNYDYNGKYYFTATARYDGASNFAANHKWGFFPSTGIKWRVSEEQFFKNLNIGNIISNLAFRGSYGLSGNQGIDNYESLPRMGNNAAAYVFGGSQVLGFTQTQLANNELTWETSAQTDIGADIGLFKGRLTLDANYFNINTRDLLLNVQIPTQVGFSSTLVNLGKTETKGIELGITGDIIKSKSGGFSWSSTLNMATNKQKIIDIGPLVRVALDNNNYGAITNYLEVGVPIGAQFGVEYMGTWKNQEEINAELAKPKGQRDLASNGSMYKPGKPRYKDTNRDGNITAEDYVYLGSPNPTFFGGFGNTFSYKRFSFDMFLQYNAGNKMFNNIEFFMGSGSDLTNQFAYMANRWTPQNPTSDIPAVNSRDNIPSTRILHDASLIRLKSAQLSYDLKGKFPKLFRQCEVFVTGTNLWKHTKYNGFDPEVNSNGTSSTVRARDDGNYPNARTIALGLNIGL